MAGAGALDRKITLIQVVETPARLNEPVKTPHDRWTVWAEYLPGPGREGLRAGEIAAVTSARFRVRWSRNAALVTPAWRLRFDGREYNIVDVQPVGRREWLMLSAQARAE